jgi:ubiquinone/menaquinone biosynthesis C-methylase UbiE
MPGFSSSKFAAWLQKIVSERREASGLYAEIASRLPLEGARRLLDVGTGTGLQLRVIHGIQPGIELYGLDISPAAIRAAEDALGGVKVDLRAGSIESTDFPDDHFEVVTCNASMSYWPNLKGCFNEIHRILRPGGEAHLFEPHAEIDLDAALDQIRVNMADQHPLRRWGAVQLNKYGLKRGSRIGMKLYSRAELLDVIHASSFAENGSVEETSLLNIPIFLWIQLKKPAD